MHHQRDQRFDSHEHTKTRKERLFAGRGRLGLFVVAIALIGGSAIHAHEIGTSRVSVRFNEDRTYDVEIVTDAAALAEKLETTAGRTLNAETRPDRPPTL